MSYIQYSSFLEQIIRNFLPLRAFTTVSEKRDPLIFDHVSCRILLEKYKCIQQNVDQLLVCTSNQRFRVQLTIILTSCN